MNWLQLLGVCGPLFLMVATLDTPTFNQSTTTPNSWVREPNCTEGEENDKVCACDLQCVQYRDCCRSSPYFVPEEQRLEASPFTCNDLFGKRTYVMTTCPPDWSKSDINYRCEHPDTNYRDPLFDAPVTSTSTNITYQNWHCASCHQDLDADTALIWEAQFTCLNRSHVDGSDERKAENLMYNPVTSQWNFEITTSDLDTKSDSSHSPASMEFSDSMNDNETLTCNIYFKAPKMEFRYCDLGVLYSCSEDWKDIEVKPQCEAYTARFCSDFKIYRNPHCLICNNIAAPLPCYHGYHGGYGHHGGHGGYGHHGGHGGYGGPSFSMLLNWRSLKGRCGRTDVYDPLSRVCRKVFT